MTKDLVRFELSDLGEGEEQVDHLGGDCELGRADNQGAMSALPEARSFFSFARAVRTAFARSSASRRWSSDRPGTLIPPVVGVTQRS